DCFFVSFFFCFYNSLISTSYCLSLHDALPISLPIKTQSLTCKHNAHDRSLLSHIASRVQLATLPQTLIRFGNSTNRKRCMTIVRSEEHTSELQSRFYIVCRLLLEINK